ncbi:Mak10 subunit, NatC N-terminal acetyltransferase-domain-containing protein [Dioszegia hungarica]|uniref:Mak10 subunit, NatC N-terminal acetyltransferase-domain-containing protein n=1 Tax=Dioszegia hungarica TaxID=4972 RepID=A0AA38LWQ4_9TREE|nr:Mak10 subunit, NatC N-terminal acetyltransferase-domain-containing protein [Dioszegia hungarica]KAI9638952.1 Mak10 subunit, NatC N-terminal acetyltransferase-domain-containing protein [Dioszegia hungarica]
MTDITSAFKASCQAIPPAKMIKRPSTLLLDVMNAMPFFDPALDTGQVDRAATFDLSAALSVIEICGVMDKMLQLEISWHLGATLCDTVFTARYYHHPAAISGISLHSYTLAYIKSVELVYNEFAKGNVVDGEDVLLDHHGISIGMSNSVEQVMVMLDDAIQKEISSDISQRLALRRSMLSLFANSSQPLDLPRFSISPISNSPAFTPVTHLLRQAMPLMPSALCDPCLYLNRLDGQMRAVHGIVGPKAWQAYLSTEELLPYVRSVAAGRIAEMDNAYQRLSAHTQSPGIWRSIADGCAIATLRVPLQNRARQRRLYLSVAHSWHERATSAFSARDLEGFRWTHALRLDCLLEASLAAYDLNLCPPAEYAQSLWWIQQVWMHIASGLLKKLSSRPLAGASSRDQFLLRHKWARKTPYPKKGRGLVPRWDDWNYTTTETQIWRWPNGS